MGYTPNLLAKAFVTGKTGTLGLMTYKIFREMFSRQTDQILRIADRKDYQVLVSLAINPRTPTSPTDQTRQIRQMMARGVDGLLIHTRGTEEESELIHRTVEGRVPVVTFPQPTAKDLSGVVLDDTASFFRVTEHLIQLGHERIGFIGGDWSLKRPGSAKARGYYQAMQEHHLTPERLHAAPPVQAAYQLGKEIRDRFTAVICRNDYTAIGLCRGLREVGLRVPEDIAVVGHGDLELSAYFTPALTTLAVPYVEIAEAVIGLLLEQLQGAHPPRKVTMSHRLIVRESCGASPSVSGE